MMGVVVGNLGNAFNTSIWEAVSEFEAKSSLHSEFQDSQGYVCRETQSQIKISKTKNLGGMER